MTVSWPYGVAGFVILSNAAMTGSLALALIGSLFAFAFAWSSVRLDRWY